MKTQSHNKPVIPLHIPSVGKQEMEYVRQALLGPRLSGDGLFTKRCHDWIQERLHVKYAMLTNSGTAALEIAALLCGVGDGDEVIMPSFTFVSTANAFLLRGARLRFVDIRRDTLNLDENLVSAAISPRTTVLVPVHYGGVGCDMASIMSLAKRHGFRVVEDAAQALGATYDKKHLGTIGDVGAYSFHETKNITCGEGGALVTNNQKFAERAEIIREKGTDRSRFLRGEVDKYTWVDLGSSYLPSEVLAALLLGQLERYEEITEKRTAQFDMYNRELAVLAEQGTMRLPLVPARCRHNAHLFYILVNDLQTRDRLLAYLRARGIGATFHYVPLHLSPMGARLGYRRGEFPVTEELSACLLRLPLYTAMSEQQQARVIKALKTFFRQGAR